MREDAAGRPPLSGSASRNSASIPDDKIMAMGKRTAANANTAEDSAMETQIRAQYREMSQTSKNVQHAVDADGKEQLPHEQAEFFKLQESRKREAELEKKLAKTPDDEGLAKELEQLRGDNQTEDARIRNVLRGTFGGVQAELEADITAATERHKTDDKHDAKWKQQELDVLKPAHDNFEDPARVFGTYHKDKKTQALVADDQKVSQVSLMQYLNHGFVRDDGTDYASLKAKGKQGAVFNEDVVATLMRHGFQSGSYFGDTMHFDFVESQTNLVPGGRNRINMSKDRASPENELPDVVNVPTTAVPANALPSDSVFKKSHPLSFPRAQPPKGSTTMDEAPNPLQLPKGIMDQ